MADRTPHEDGRDGAEQLLDQLLSLSHAQLLDSVSDAIDSDVGLNVLQPLRAQSGHGRNSEHRRRFATRVYTYGPLLPILSEATDSLAETLQRVERLQGLVGEIARFAHAVATRSVETSAEASLQLLGQLASGLEHRSLTQAQVRQLFSALEQQVARTLQAMKFTEHVPNAYRSLLVHAETLPALRALVMRLFDDADDNARLQN